VKLIISEEYFVNADCLHLSSEHLESGAYYKLDTYLGNYLNLQIWLCDVVVFVFGYFPENIYFAKVK
jgi:hypothetical protein